MPGNPGHAKGKSGFHPISLSLQHKIRYIIDSNLIVNHLNPQPKPGKNYFTMPGSGTARTNGGLDGKSRI
jgi:hypothetical protein